MIFAEEMDQISLLVCLIVFTRHVFWCFSIISPDFFSCIYSVGPVASKSYRTVELVNFTVKICSKSAEVPIPNSPFWLIDVDCIPSIPTAISSCWPVIRIHHFILLFRRWSYKQKKLHSWFIRLNLSKWITMLVLSMGISPSCLDCFVSMGQPHQRGDGFTVNQRMGTAFITEVWISRGWLGRF